MKAQFTNIYVKNLDPEVTQDDFTELFQQFGNVTSAVVQFDDEGKSKGFGFVDVGDEEQQKNAIELLNGKEISGRPIAVKIAVNTPHDDDDEAEDAEKADAPAEVAPAAEA